MPLPTRHINPSEMGKPTEERLEVDWAERQFEYGWDGQVGHGIAAKPVVKPKEKKP